MVLLVAVDMGLQASSGCRGVVDAAVGMGNQAASRDGIDTLTPKCIEGLADLLASYGLRVGEKKRTSEKEHGAGTEVHGHLVGTLGALSILLIPTTLDRSHLPRPEADCSISRHLHHKASSRDNGWLIPQLQPQPGTFHRCYP